MNRIIIDATNIYHTYILYSLTYTLHTQNDISPPKNIFSSLREIRLHKPDTSPLLYSTQREYLLELGKNNWKSRLEKNLHIAQDNKKITEIFLVCLNFLCNIYGLDHFFPYNHFIGKKIENIFENIHKKFGFVSMPFRNPVLLVTMIGEIQMILPIYL